MIKPLWTDSRVLTYRKFLGIAVMDFTMFVVGQTALRYTAYIILTCVLLITIHYRKATVVTVYVGN